MSENQQHSGQPAREESATASPIPLRARVRFIDQILNTDAVSLGALITAVAAGIVGIVQTGFMWVARNDEVEAALRAEQIRACAAYRLAALDVNERAQYIARDGLTPSDEVEFPKLVTNYRNVVGQLGYLLPESSGEALEALERASVEAFNAFADGDMERLAAASAADSPWSRAHDGVLEACEAVIRDVRDR